MVGTNLCFTYRSPRELCEGSWRCPSPQTAYGHQGWRSFHGWGGFGDSWSTDFPGQASHSSDTDFSLSLYYQRSPGKCPLYIPALFWTGTKERTSENRSCELWGKGGGHCSFPGPSTLSSTLSSFLRINKVFNFLSGWGWPQSVWGCHFLWAPMTLRTKGPHTFIHTHLQMPDICQTKQRCTWKRFFQKKNRFVFSLYLQIHMDPGKLTLVGWKHHEAVQVTGLYLSLQSSTLVIPPTSLTS